MSHCVHAFFEVREKSETRRQATHVVCAYCAQVRVLWAEGEVWIIKESGVVIRKEKDTSNVASGSGGVTA